MQFKAEKIRNVCLLGHKGNGKTTLVESMLFFAKASERLGKISQGNTVCDFDPEEIKRQMGISLSVAPLVYNDVKINLVDTPGFYDFEGENISGLTVCDVGAVVVSGKTKVSVGTEKAVKKCATLEKPMAFIITNLDDENGDFYNTVNQLCEKFDSQKIVPLWLPLIENSKVVGVIDVLKSLAYKFTSDGKKIGADIPSDIDSKISVYKNMIFEAIAETDEALMEKFFSEEAFTDEEIKKGVKDIILQRLIYPVFLAVPTQAIGIETLIDFIANYFPSPIDAPAIKAKDQNGEMITIKCSDSDPVALRIFKTIADPFVGKVSYFKIYSGVVAKDSSYVNVRTDDKEKIAHVYYPFGKKQIEVDKLYAGDIGVFTKLSNTNTSDTLSDKSRIVEFDAIKFPKPNYTKAILPKAKGDEEKISQGIARLVEEDPTLKFEINKETKQQLISGLGDIQLDIVVSKLKSKFQTDVELADQKVAYRETIKKKAKVEGKHKKQSGGHGQYGHVWIEFEPCYDSEFVFEEKIFGGSVPKNFFPAVEKGLRESILNGVIAGYPVTNIKATLLDGSYHPVDSSEMAFKIAASIAFKEGMKNANPVILEPIGKLVVNVSDLLMGDIIGDINKRRGQVLSMDSADEKGRKLVEAYVPMSEMNSYAMDLRSMTHARATFTFDFVEYREAPPNIAEKIANANQ